MLKQPHSGGADGTTAAIGGQGAPLRVSPGHARPVAGLARGGFRMGLPAWMVGCDEPMARAGSLIAFSGFVAFCRRVLGWFSRMVWM
jgi:hypothetical protein